MKRILIIAGIGATLLATSGCVIHLGEDIGQTHDSVRAEEMRARHRIAEWPLGTPSSVVLAELGTPAFTDLVDTPSGELRVLRYRTHRTHADGETTRDETTPLLFRDGRLVVSGELALGRELGR